MFFRLLKSKKGITLVEMIVVVLILGILTAVGVPVFASGYRKQAREDCANQCTVIEALVKEAMYGMIDNGMAQYKRDSALNPVEPKTVWIDFSKVQGDHKTVYEDDGIDGNSDDAYDGKACFVLIEDQKIPGQIAFTLGDLRGGYRANKNQEYNEGCKTGNYLKKEKLKDVKFYKYLANQEIPVCPFNDAEKGKNYYYYIFEDGSVICSCPECHEN